MAKSKSAFVVLQTNTNQDNAVFGPFKTHEEAEGFAFKMGNVDHLHVFNVLEIQDPEEGTPEEE